MGIREEIVAAATEQGYDGPTPTTIAGAVDALTEALGGEPSGGTIAQAVHALAPNIGGGGSESVSYDNSKGCYVAFVNDSYRNSTPTFGNVSGNLELKTAPVVPDVSGGYTKLFSEDNEFSPNSGNTYFVTAGVTIKVPLNYTVTGATLWKTNGRGGFAKYADYDDNFFTGKLGGTDMTFTTIPSEEWGGSGPSFYLVYLHATS